MFRHGFHKAMHRGGCFATRGGGEGDSARGEGFGRFARRGGGPFGRHRSGPFGGRGRRMFDSGALRLVVLGLIADEPRHGYDIIKALETRFQGTYSPSPGAIYPLLQMLEEADYVASSANGNKRLYTITDAGRAHLAENQAYMDQIQAQLDAASGEIQRSAMGIAIHDLRRTLFHKLRSGELTSDQIDRLRAALERARHEIEQI